MLGLHEMIDLSNQEFTEISRIFQSLSPIKVAIEALCRRDSNLIVAEATIKFLLDEIQSSRSYFGEKTRKAIDQRSTGVLYSCFQCLHNLQAQMKKRSEIVAFCNYLLSRLILKVVDEKILLEDIVELLDFHLFLSMNLLSLSRQIRGDISWK